MCRPAVAFGVAALLVLPRLTGAQCDPAQFNPPFGWLVGSGSTFEPTDVANRIAQRFLNGDVRVRDAEIAKSEGLYERYDLHVSELSFRYNPDLSVDADLRVAVTDWQGRKFRDGTPPAFVEPCESARLIHSKIWHVQSDSVGTYDAIASYYFNNRNALPAIFEEYYTGWIIPDIGPTNDRPIKPVLRPRGFMNTGGGRARSAWLKTDAGGASSQGASIRFGLQRAATASLDVYDTQGRLVRRLVDGWVEAGDHSATWNGRDDDGRSMPAGIYFIRLRAAEGSLLGRVIHLR